MVHIQMTTQELAYEVISRLKKEYPDADCTLDYDDAWKLLVSVRLAAQCTDARGNVGVQDLYAKYPDVAALAAAEPEAIEAIVRPCGLGKSKARDISACMRILHEQYHDKVPEDFNALLKLPGVGRKSANLIMGDVFGKPAIVTDTHCIRKRWKWLSGRSSLRKKAMISATVLSIMEEKSVQRGQSLTVTAAVSMISAKKMGSECMQFNKPSDLGKEKHNEFQKTGK